MREITTKVYTFDELNEAAQNRAVQAVAEKLGGAWWDSGDIDDLRDAMVYAFAEQLGTPGWDTYGQGDFPGIPGVKLTEWDLDRGQSIRFDGRLDPDNAPAIPWVDGIDEVSLSSGRHYIAQVEASDDAAATDIEAIREEVTDALHHAWKAGRDELEYKTGEEHAREWIEFNSPEFNEDGTLH